MSSLRNAISRRAHKERAQPHDRKKFGLLEKHKDYVVRARAFHQKEETLRKLKEKAAFRNPDEFYFKMVNTRTVDGIHRPEGLANKYSQEELMLMKTQDAGYILQKVQSERKKVEKLSSVLHSLDNGLQNKHTYFAEDRSIETCQALVSTFDTIQYADESSFFVTEEEGQLFVVRQILERLREVSGLKVIFEQILIVGAYIDHKAVDEAAIILGCSVADLSSHIQGCLRLEEAREVQSKLLQSTRKPTFEHVPGRIKRKMETSYRELEERKKRVNDLEKLYMDMVLQKELQKRGRKRKLKEDEIVCPTTKPVYKWWTERKR